MTQFIIHLQKLKSMQPDSDDEAVEKRTKKMLKRIAKYRGKSKAAAVPDTTNDSDEEETKVISSFHYLSL